MSAIPTTTTVAPLSSKTRSSSSSSISSISSAVCRTLLPAAASGRSGICWTTTTAGTERVPTSDVGRKLWACCFSTAATSPTSRWSSSLSSPFSIGKQLYFSGGFDASAGGRVFQDTESLVGGKRATECGEFVYGRRRSRSLAIAECPSRRAVILSLDLERNSGERSEGEAGEGGSLLHFNGVGQGGVNSAGRHDGGGCGQRKYGDAGSFSRRLALFSISMALSIPVCLGSEAAFAAFSPGFSGLKDWLKGQKQKSAGFLLAPITASRDRLASALLLVSPENVSTANYREAGNLVKVAARDCMPTAAGSFQDFQKRSGVEVCTFKLVLKNAASLRDNDDPVKLNAEESLTNLVRSFVTLDGMLAAGAAGGILNRCSARSIVGDVSSPCSI